jgi:monofunctional glycosyltransferase
MDSEADDAPNGPPCEDPDRTIGPQSHDPDPHARRNRALRVAGVVLAALFAVVLLAFVTLRFVNPPTTAVMLVDGLGGQMVRHRWVPLKDISPWLPRAVIASEDGRFCIHWGVDWGAVREAVEEALHGESPRGASTIPMQTVKNLFLWKNRSYVRKVLEVPLAYLAVAIWGRPRTMELYLNIVQWGPGIYGAEAASRYHFGIDASQLTQHQAALLAAALPDPDGRYPGHPGPLLRKIAGEIEWRIPIMHAREACVFRGKTP